MKFNQRKQEKGSILMEVIAVIAVLGVMGPLLFKQVSDRNEEIENINIASEIRTIKEGFAAYIMSYKADMMSRCGSATNCTGSIRKTDLERFLPRGFDDTLGDYTLVLLTDDRNDGSTQLQGFIIPNLANMGLEDSMTVRQAARIANLIGADGGIHRNASAEVNGTGGTWSIEADAIGLAGAGTTFLATTGIDTFSPEVRLEDFDQANIFLPNSLGMTDLHAWNYFSVGGSAPDSSASCFQLNHTTRDSDASGAIRTTAKDDKIYVGGELNHKGTVCEPYFWVGYEGNGSTKTATGDVYIKQNLHFRESASGNDAITIASGCDKDNCTDKIASRRHITVYGMDGTERVVIDATGKIVSRGPNDIDKSQTVKDEGLEKESLTIYNGRIESNAYAENASADHNNETAENVRLGYKLDPRYTSVMNDIRLESRGGARLSDLLPNYSLVDVKAIDNTTAMVEKPRCPSGHAPAIVILPVSWNTTTEKTIADTVANKMVVEGTSIKAKTENAPSSTSTLLPKVVISDTEKYTEINNAGSTGGWSISLGYNNDTANNTPIKALAYLYCYFPQQTSAERNARNRPADASETTTLAE